MGRAQRLKLVLVLVAASWRWHLAVAFAFVHSTIALGRVYDSLACPPPHPNAPPLHSSILFRRWTDCGRQRVRGCGSCTEHIHIAFLQSWSSFFNRPLRAFFRRRTPSSQLVDLVTPIHLSFTLTVSHSVGSFFRNRWCGRGGGAGAALRCCSPPPPESTDLDDAQRTPHSTFPRDGSDRVCKKPQKQLLPPALAASAFSCKKDFLETRDNSGGTNKQPSSSYLSAVDNQNKRSTRFTSTSRMKQPNLVSVRQPWALGDVYFEVYII